MMSGNSSALDRLQADLGGRVAWLAMLALGIAAPVLYWLDPRAGNGIALGGGLGLGLFLVSRELAGMWLRRRTRRSAALLWAIWVLKWPLTAGLLYLVLDGGWANPVWICVGASVVPTTATAVTLAAAIRGDDARVSVGETRL